MIEHSNNSHVHRRIGKHDTAWVRTDSQIIIDQIMLNIKWAQQKMAFLFHWWCSLNLQARSIIIDNDCFIYLQSSSTAIISYLSFLFYESWGKTYELRLSPFFKVVTPLLNTSYIEYLINVMLSSLTCWYIVLLCDHSKHMIRHLLRFLNA